MKRTPPLGGVLVVSGREVVPCSTLRVVHGVEPSYARGESNSQVLTDTRPSTVRVCLFRHSRAVSDRGVGYLSG